MTDVDRKIAQLRRLLYATHDEDYDFIYLPASDARTIVRLLEEYRRDEKERAEERYRAQMRMVSGVRFVKGGNGKT